MWKVRGQLDPRLSCELSLAGPDIDTIFHILSRIHSEGSPTTPFKSSIFTMYKALCETIGNVGNLRGTLLKTKFKYSISEKKGEWKVCWKKCPVNGTITLNH